MKLLAVADEECKALWDYYSPDKLKDVEMILACGDLNRHYLEYLVTMAPVPVFYVHGNHDESFDARPPEGAVCIDDDVIEYHGLRIAGLGGACVTMAIMNQFRPISIVGQGFIAMAAVIFGKFRPQGALVACLLFGFCTGLKVVMGSNNVVSAQLISMIPYVVTVIVLILFVGRSRTPSASGKPYAKSR